MSADNKKALHERFERLLEGIEERDKKMLSEIYTELYITDGVSEEVNTQHEIRQIEIRSQRVRRTETAIRCNDLFHPSPGQACVRTVMTQGIAGIGKTVSVQKFILDWAEGRANQDIDFIIVLPFRELNLVQDVQYSLLKLLLDFHPELRTEVDAQFYHKSRIIFVFDGLDESKLPLNFEENRNLSDITEATSVDMLVTNLIRKKLLPCALKWITSRPAAANQVPSEFIDKWMEVRGFTDQQKEKYFKKRIKCETEANRIVSQIKKSTSLYIMCHIPVFCWILATVIQRIQDQRGNRELPQTLTEVFIQFLIIQNNTKNMKYGKKNEKRKLFMSNKLMILKLSELAFKHLEKGNIFFTEENLAECRIAVSEDLEKSGMCTEIFAEEPVIQKRKLFCFVHLSIQEFLAALYVFQSFLAKNTDALASFPRKEETLHDLLKSAIDKSLQSTNGHLDLFLRFLMGISLESNQNLLHDLMPHTHQSSESLKIVAGHIRKIIRQDYDSTERSMNLLLCLLEVKDNSLHEEMKKYLEWGTGLSEADCSTIAYMLLMSDDILDLFDLRKYNTFNQGRKRLVIAVRNCKKAQFSGCGLSLGSCEVIASALQVEDSPVQELDLSSNPLLDPGVQALCAGLTHTNCQLRTLRLAQCGLTVGSCETLTAALQSETSQLRELDLSYNDLDDHGIQLLTRGLTQKYCKLEVLRLAFCKLRESFRNLASVLQSGHSQLRELDLSNNDLTDDGAIELSTGLSHPHCRLRTLRLSGCLITKRGCRFLSLALKSNPSHLRELDLSYNHLEDSGVRTLSALLNQECKLLKLKTDHDALCWLKPGLQKYNCEPRLDPSTALQRLNLSDGNTKVTLEQEKDGTNPKSQHFNVLCRDGLTGRHYWEVEWSGLGASIGVTYRSIIREGGVYDCMFGDSDKSWCVECYDTYFGARHNEIETDIHAPPSDSHKVGVYLDWPAGTLSFYSVSSNTLTHWYTFHTTFTEPLYPAFSFTFMFSRFYGIYISSSVTISQIHTDRSPSLPLPGWKEEEEEEAERGL
ncbi:NACHT, LRR and PYD domains-containing protein 12-like [Alosa sapidissima]|uniref:NACHT, LRR and PYD domains-containing protein 12-like n=1 Tax=Alosa sapidissima TaxID=34773 RepID=UPI001C09AE7F|nr:NACHT, LRR and PYD domains-containing protein 12-like [Alosa sapidissima]